MQHKLIRRSLKTEHVVLKNRTYFVCNVLVFTWFSLQTIFRDVFDFVFLDLALQSLNEDLDVHSNLLGF